jgi:hypothetical protein
MIKDLLDSLNTLMRIPSVLGIAAAVCLGYASSGHPMSAGTYLVSLLDGLGLCALAVVELLVSDISDGSE